MSMESMRPESSGEVGLRNLIEERALALLADFRPGASHAVAAGTFPGLLQLLEERLPGARVIGVVGEMANTAASRVVEGLAVAASLVGRRTLVIDSDTTAPRQHLLWNGPGAPLGPGFRDILLAGLPVPPDSIHPTRHSHCRLIPAGYPADLPDALLLGSDNVERLFGIHAPAMADTVVVALPPLTVDGLSGSVGVHMEGVVVVLGHRTDVVSTGVLIDNLLESGTRVVGVVIVPSGPETAVDDGSPGVSPQREETVSPTAEAAGMGIGGRGEALHSDLVLEAGSVDRAVDPVADSGPESEGEPAADHGSETVSRPHPWVGAVPDAPDVRSFETTEGPSSVSAVLGNAGSLESVSENEGAVGIDDLSSLLAGWRRRAFAPAEPASRSEESSGPAAEPAWNLLPLEQEEWTRGAWGSDGVERSPSAPPPVPAAVEPGPTEDPVVLEPVAEGEPELVPLVPTGLVETSESVAAQAPTMDGDGGAVSPAVDTTDLPLPQTQSEVSVGPTLEEVSSDKDNNMEQFADLGAGMAVGTRVASAPTVVSGKPAVFEVTPSGGGRLTLSASTMLTGLGEALPARVELSVDASSLRSMRGTAPDSGSSAMVLDILVADTRTGCGMRLLAGRDLSTVLEVVFEPGSGFRFASGPAGATAPRVSFETTADGGSVFRAQSAWIDAELVRRPQGTDDASLWSFRLQVADGR